MSKYKIGDSVFVVHQLSRNQIRNKLPAETNYAKIEKVGRKYAYIERGRFSIATGESNHSCSTIRANGYGFDVYETEQSYLKKMNEDQEYERLKARLRCDYRFPALTPLTVSLINQVLDDSKEC